MTHTLHHGDCLEVLRTMPACSVDACVTDPPYGLSFMGSGTTIKAALSEGFNAIGIERDADYFAMAEHRMNGAQLGLTLEATA